MRREFGFELEKVRYEPFYNLTSSQLKEMIPRFKWLEAPWDAITNELAQNSESKTSWYNTKIWPLRYSLSLHFILIFTGYRLSSKKFELFLLYSPSLLIISLLFILLFL